MRLPLAALLRFGFLGIGHAHTMSVRPLRALLNAASEIYCR